MTTTPILDEEVVALKLQLAEAQERADTLQNDFNLTTEECLAIRQTLANLQVEFNESKQVAEGLATVVAHLRSYAEDCAVERSVLFGKMEEHEREIEIIRRRENHDWFENQTSKNNMQEGKRLEIQRLKSRNKRFKSRNKRFKKRSRNNSRNRSNCDVRNDDNDNDNDNDNGNGGSGGWANQIIADTPVTSKTDNDDSTVQTKDSWNSNGGSDMNDSDDGGDSGENNQTLNNLSKITEIREGLTSSSRSSRSTNNESVAPRSQTILPTINSSPGNPSTCAIKPNNDDNTPQVTPNSNFSYENRHAPFADVQLEVDSSVEHSIPRDDKAIVIIILRPISIRTSTGSNTTNNRRIKNENIWKNKKIPMLWR